MVLAVKKRVFFLAIILASALADAQSRLDIVCSSNHPNKTLCESMSPNATTKSNVVVDLGTVNSVKLRNIMNVPIMINNSENTDTMYLFADIVNRGIPQDLAIDLRSKYNEQLAPTWISTAPKASSGLVVVDSVASLEVDVSGHKGRDGKSLSKLCGDKVLNQGYFSNPNNTAEITGKNNQIKAALSDGTCSVSTLEAITAADTGSFCPSGYSYLSGRDNQSQPILDKPDGPVFGTLSSFNSEGPVRLAFMKKCVKTVQYRTCRYFSQTLNHIEYDTVLTCGERYLELQSNNTLPSGMQYTELSTVIKDSISYVEENSETPEAEMGKCPGAPYEVLESYTQLHDIDNYEQFDCKFGDCPKAFDTYTYAKHSPISFEVGRGEPGSQGGRFDIFAYDIGSTILKYSNGSNGRNGVVDLGIPTVKRFCVKVSDARTAGFNNEIARIPLVNFHTSQYSPIAFTLPQTVPGTAFKSRSLIESVGIFKKVDSSVRNFVTKEFIDPRFL